MTNRLNKLGMDIGNVVIDNPRGPNVDPVDKYNPDLLPVIGSMATIARLGHPEHFGDRIWLFKRCDSVVKNKIHRWFGVNEFHDLTGVPPGNVKLYRESDFKSSLAEDLELTHYVAHKLGSLVHLIDIVPNLYLLGGDPAEIEEHAAALPGIIQAPDWAGLEPLLMAA